MTDRGRYVWHTQSGKVCMGASTERKLDSQEDGNYAGWCTSCGEEGRRVTWAQVQALTERPQQDVQRTHGLWLPRDLQP